MYGKMTVCLSSMIIIIIGAKSCWNWALLPLFLLHTLLPIHTVFPLMLICHPFCSTVSSPQYCLPSQLLHFVIHPLYLSSNIALFIFFPCLFFPLLFSPPLSSFLGLVILTCWLKENIVTSTRKQPNLFASSQTHYFKFKCVSCKQWLTLEKAKLPPPPQPPHCLWALLKG